MGKSAPEITTVSNPKIKPAKAAINEMPNKELLPLDDPVMAVEVAADVSICIKYGLQVFIRTTTKQEGHMLSSY